MTTAVRRVLALAAAALALASAEEAAPRVAIIGSGISGASAAYFLSRARPDARVVVFERAAETGGRMRSRTWGGPGGLLIDEGATTISSLNAYLVHWIAQFNLTKAQPPPGDLAITDGKSILFRADTSSALFGLRVLWRYGVSPLKLRTALKATVANLTAVYELQDKGAFWASPSAMFQQLGLWDSTQIDARTYFTRLGIEDRFVREFVDGASRDNYMQSADQLNALVDLVSLAGAALEGDVFRLAGGTQQLGARVLEASGAEVRLRTAVRRVAASGSGAGGGFSVTSGPASAGGGEAGALSVTEAFDAVVIAAPLEASGLMLDLGGSAAPPRERPFVHTHATFVEAAQLNPKKFGKEAASRTGAVLTTADAGEDGYFAIGVQGYATPANDTEPATCAGGTGGAAAPGAAGAPADAAGTPADAAGAKRCFASAAAAAAAGKPPPRAKPGKPPPLARAAARRRVYKLFSSRPLSDTQLDEILEGRSGDAVRAVWESPGAYPRLLPTAEWPDFELAKGVAYAGALESPVSCMETQAIAGRNAALLVAEHIRAD